GLHCVMRRMQRISLRFVPTISSRSSDRAREAAQKAGIPKAYGTYEELLSDPDIDAVYNPLPNHLHVPWSIKALEAGKHVLCEKPIGMDAAEAEQLRDAAKRFPNLKIMEAFMYRLHPQWVKAKELVQSGAIGKVQTIHSFFCYNNTDPANVR